MTQEPERTVDDLLRENEPPRTDDDTNPHTPVTLDERLAAEEPPVSDDDTAPRTTGSFVSPLAEPPVNDGDTSPTPAIYQRRQEGGG
ncbi:MAG: hypothetical protein GYB65_14435, partial [Chloroflexi bacterium]|nr:hypothetical protein [Chloroflexota bacterium]